jgi:ring-1,2-phenylacetyl-CoA epoxidase subunit PaaC
LGDALARATNPNDDPNLIRFIWMGWQDAIAAHPVGALKLAAGIRMPLLREWMARRIAEQAGETPALAIDLLAAISAAENDDVRLNLLAGLAANSLKQAKYHVRHSGEWMIKLGDGTDESHRRVQQALDALWRFTPELFVADDVAARLAAQGIGPDLPALRPRWDSLVRDVVDRATLTLPHDAVHSPHVPGGRTGMHSEQLGHLLAEMQIVARSHPGAKW